MILFFFAVFFLLFTQNRLITEGIQDGLLLWYNGLVPSLFPFLMLTQFLLTTDAMDGLAHFLETPCKKLFGVGGQGAFVILCGFFCGYPIGAATASRLWKQGRLSTPETQRLLSFCNNTSPGFLQLYVCGTCLAHRIPGWMILLPVYGAALLIGLIKGRRPLPRTEENGAAPAVPSGRGWMEDSIQSVLMLAGYTVLFSIIAKMVTAPTGDVTILQSYATGILEITTGTRYISRIQPLYLPAQAMLIFTLAFGGISCIFQTKAFLTGANPKGETLSVCRYAADKLENGVLAVILFLLLRFLTGRLL